MGSSLPKGKGEGGAPLVSSSLWWVIVVYNHRDLVRVANKKSNELTLRIAMMIVASRGELIQRNNEKEEREWHSEESWKDGQQYLSSNSTTDASHQWDDRGIGTTNGEEGTLVI